MEVFNVKSALYYRKTLDQNYYYGAIMNIVRVIMEQACDKHIFDCALDNSIDKGKIEIDMPAKDVIVDQESLTVIINRYGLDTVHIRKLINKELEDAGYKHINTYLEENDIGVLQLRISFEF